MSDYPIPHYAASVWAVGDRLAVAFPPLPGNDRGHTTHFPLNEHGIRALALVLREREKHPGGKIATRSQPTQYNIDEMIKAMKITVIGKRDGSHITSIEQLGL